MKKELAIQIAAALAERFDKHTPTDMMCISSYECEKMEFMLVGEEFDRLHEFIRNKWAKINSFTHDKIFDGYADN